jgi:hypothetical protein
MFDSVVPGCLAITQGTMLISQQDGETISLTLIGTLRMILMPLNPSRKDGIPAINERILYSPDHGNFSRNAMTIFAEMSAASWKNVEISFSPGPPPLNLTKTGKR